VFIIDMLDGSK